MGLKLNTYHLSYFIYKNNAKDIADISSMQDACHIWTSLQTLLTVKSIWLNGRASEKGIRSSEVRFLMGTKNIFFVPQSTKNILFHFFTELKIDHLSVGQI